MQGVAPRIVRPFMERAVGDPPFEATVAGAGNPEVMIQFGTAKWTSRRSSETETFGFSGPVWWKALVPRHSSRRHERAGKSRVPEKDIRRRLGPGPVCQPSAIS
jgi:hypothetical protein